MRRSLYAALCLWCACNGDPGQSPPRVGSPHTFDGGTNAASVLDTDHDGLCDPTEADFGTDPEVADSDHDGMPDLIELANGFDATDPTQPAADQTAYLEAHAGATLDFPVRITVEGTGEGLSGYFEAIESIYADGGNAEDYYRGTAAVSADPVDGVRRIDPGAARFWSVLGRARLGFSLHFTYATDGDQSQVPPCAFAYPFRYSLKSDAGELLDDRDFLLVVGPEAASGAKFEYCLPADCQ
jgi:hypothetical protein